MSISVKKRGVGVKYVKAADDKDIGQVQAFYRQGKLEVEVQQDEVRNKFLLIDDKSVL